MIVDYAIYEHGKRLPEQPPLPEAAKACRGSDRFAWLGLYEPTEEEFDAVGRDLGLHELAVEDAINAHQRPKLEVYGDSLFVVLKTARYLDATETIEFGEIQVFLGDGFAVVVRHGEASALTETRRQLEARPDLLAMGPAAVLYSIVDRVVDDYLPVIVGIDDDIGEVELQVFSETDAHNPVERIYKLKREVLETNRSTAPLLGPLETLATEKMPWVSDPMREYFRDVQDHLQRTKDQIETFSELLTSILEANLTRVGVQQNADMRKISAWVAIAAIPTLVGGIYGMNFEHMPELGERWAYPAVLVLIAVSCLALYAAFRRNGWL